MSTPTQTQLRRGRIGYSMGRYLLYKLTKDLDGPSDDVEKGCGILLLHCTGLRGFKPVYLVCIAPRFTITLEIHLN